MPTYLIYEIRNAHTNHVYFGMTRTGRLIRPLDHFSALRAGKHPSPKFQEEWNKSSGITDWCIRIRQDGIAGSRNARAAEKKWIMSEDLDLVLNQQKSNRIDWATIASVRAMRSEGHTVRLIAEKYGISPSTVSKIANHYGTYCY